MEELHLVYINRVGTNWVGEYEYEFLFSNTTEDIDGDDWDSYPASGKPTPPEVNLIKLVGKITTELKLDLIQYSDTFAVWDAVDGIIALGWENISDYESYPDKRLYFKFGDNKKSIDDALYESDMVLEYNDNIKIANNEN
jgi:hypothetical protein